MVEWRPAGEYEDIRYQTAEGMAKVTIARPEVRNAFRPRTLFELSTAFDRARDDREVGVVILTGEGPDAFCSGGDQRVRGDDGYQDEQGIGRLNVLDLQVQIRRLPKPVVAMVAGYAIGGGHVLHLVCDLSIAADNARGTPRPSITCRTRRRRGATRIWRSARRTSAGSRGGRDRPRGLGERGTSPDPGGERGPGGGGDGGGGAGLAVADARRAGRGPGASDRRELRQRLPGRHAGR